MRYLKDLRGGAKYVADEEDSCRGIRGASLIFGEAESKRKDVGENSYVKGRLTGFHSLHCDVGSLGSVIELNGRNIAASLDCQ